MLEFIAKTDSADFDGGQALDLLHRRYTIDYGSGQAGSSAADPNDQYFPIFYLDYISIVGLPLRPITRTNERFFDNVVVTFKDWHRPYPAKHHFKMPFDLKHRTFRLATAATRETWYIVMHPIVAPAVELLGRGARRKKEARSSKASALRLDHAQALASYITWVFQTADLAGERVEPLWTLNSSLTQTLTANRWTTFQERFVEGWATHVARFPADPFWQANVPAFHAHDYGANIEITVSDAVASLMPETRLRPDEDDLSDGEADTRAGETLGVEGSHVPAGTAQGTPHGWPFDVGSSEDDLYSDGLRELGTELHLKYLWDNISSASYAVAVSIHCLDADGSPWCLLADRNAIQEEYASTSGPSGMMFYSLANHPRYGNFTSDAPPRFLDDRVFAAMKDNMSYQNDGAEVLSCDYCQGYSDLKRVFRYNPDDLLAGKGTATAALTLPDSEAKSSARVRDRQQGLLERLQGEATPDNPEASRPFAREQQRVEHAIGTNEFAFRIEQVFNLDVARLVPARRNIWTVLRPIFQLMRFYLQEAAHYTPFLRRFRPTVFPKILGSFARVFDAALGEMLTRYRAQGSKGLGLALAEGVAALDRLGHYCFTGMPKVLVRSVLGPLGTLESLRTGAWPYLDPAMLDLRCGEGLLDVHRWPRAADGRPILMHVAALHFHYGAEVAASRHSLVWFRDLGGKAITGPISAARFLEEVFRDLWIPQTVRHISQQILRRLGSGVGFEDETVADALAQQQRRRADMEAWAKCKQPFSWRRYEPIWRLATGERAGQAVSMQSQQDFAGKVYRGCLRNDGATKGTLSAPHSTWFAVLHAVFKFTPAEWVSEEQWVSCLAAALRSNEIECMPGTYRSRLSSTRVVRLVGMLAPPLVMAARSGSLKRKAMEAGLRLLQPKRRQVVDVGEMPYKCLPPLVADGFDKLAKTFASGNTKVGEHYHMARARLEELLVEKEPLCDLLLMLAVTFASSSATPTVEEIGKGFVVGDQKDAASFAANLATRMVWYLRPAKFPWDKDDGMVLRISEMTKKMEHKGVNNRFLCEMGWVRTTSTRPNPRNKDLELQPGPKLLERLKGLRSLQKRPNLYFEEVFLSQEWAKRCATLVRELE